ncbi:E3 ubiquitin-protein ligase traf7 [Polyrhizophydium stewartii]|uniref:E3 ubiquitin-protein ligase traf7 n=1 Tax=Polyrhizophydium stewartii TaxID=2732419 RepID=A0ABR4NJE7_9FUNG
MATSAAALAASQASGGSAPAQAAPVFVQQPSASLLCPICQDVYTDPVITSGCHHSFCAACIAQSLTFESHCPLCRGRLQASDLHPNLALAGLISELLVFCRFRDDGCTQQIRLESLQSHIDQCPFAPRSCEFQRYGCAFKAHMTICSFHQLKAFIVATDRRIGELESLGADNTDAAQAVGEGMQLDGGPGPAIGGKGRPRSGSIFREPIQDIWNAQGSTLSSQGTIDSHSGKVYSLEVYGNLLISGSSDQTIKLWNLQTSECVMTLTGHSAGINSLSLLPGDRLASVSSDKSIKIWDLHQGVAVHSISHLTSDALDVCHGSGMLFASTLDANIVAYNLNNYTRVGTLSGHRWEVWQVEYTSGTLFSGSHDHTIKRWDLRKFQSTADLTGHKRFSHGLKGYIHALASADACLLSGCGDKTVRVWGTASRHNN